jgi:hypothetical protein
MIQDWCLSPARIQAGGACGSWIILAGVPVARLCAVTGDRFAVRMTNPVRHAPADRGASVMAVRKTLSAACAEFLRPSVRVRLGSTA